LQACEEFGIQVSESPPPASLETTSHPERDHLRPEEIELLLRSKNPPTAVVCWEDACAEVTLSQLSLLGLECPADIAVLGYNGIPRYGLEARPLTTIDAHWFQVGRTAVQTLRRLLGGEPPPSETVVDVSLRPGTTD
jgi:DNA-binding LacI/PurR family transcriptional regulator